VTEFVGYLAAVLWLLESLSHLSLLALIVVTTPLVGLAIGQQAGSARWRRRLASGLLSILALSALLRARWPAHLLALGNLSFLSSKRLANAEQDYVSSETIKRLDGDLTVVTTRSGAEYVTINGRRSRIHYNKGYVYTSRPGESGTIGIHRILMELKLGRRLKRGEHVHHIDGNRVNNTLGNLEVVNGRMHNGLHTTERNLKHDPNNFVCGDCGTTKRPHKARGRCVSCWVKLRRRSRAKRPCSRCKRETINGGYYAGLCSRCATKLWVKCRVCGRSRDELPQRKGNVQIFANGFCRACDVRLKRKHKAFVSKLS